MMSRSALTTLAMPGRRTFRATVRPSRRTARWTCEIEAEATGAGSSAAKTSEAGRPYSSPRIFSTCSNPNGRTAERSAESSVMYDSGSRSGRVLRS